MINAELCESDCIDCGAHIPIPIPEHIGTNTPEGYQPGNQQVFEDLHRKHRKRCDECSHDIMMEAKRRRNGK